VTSKFVSSITVKQCRNRTKKSRTIELSLKAEKRLKAKLNSLLLQSTNSKVRPDYWKEGFTRLTARARIVVYDRC
jgi:hypothetical protein